MAALSPASPADLSFVLRFQPCDLRYPPGYTAIVYLTQVPDYAIFPWIEIANIGGESHAVHPGKEENPSGSARYT